MKARTTGNPLIIVFLFFKKIFFSLFIIFFVAILFRIRIKFFLVMCIWYKNEFIQHSFVIQCYRNGVMDLNMRKNISSFFLDKATEKMKWNLISSRPFFIHQKSNLRKKTSLCDWHEYDDDDMKSDDNIVIDLLFTTSFVLVWKKKSNEPKIIESMDVWYLIVDFFCLLLSMMMTGVNIHLSII